AFSRIWLLGLVLAGCWGGSLDRKDGALRIVLRDVPSETVHVGAELSAGSRKFHALVPRPVEDVFIAFSAIPAGDDVLDLRLYGAGFTTIKARSGVKLTVAANRTLTATISFSDGPDFTIDQPSEGAYRTDDRIPLVIKLVDPSIPTALSVSASG